MSAIEIAISLFVLLFAITVHEAAHAWAARRMGDPTASDLGRITLNPIAHLDPVGSIILPIMLVVMKLPAFGWAKPVPVNPYNLRHPRRDNMLISAAGPLSNLLVGSSALILLVILKFLSPSVRLFLNSPSLYRALLPKGFYPLEGLALILYFAVLINLYLAVFNLIPVPPLDGSGIVAGILTERGAARYESLRPYGFFIVLALLYLDVLNIIILPINIFISMLLR